ncbi:MAG: hypothetical protein Q8P67_13235 [archaeon]|nr:hypothetical protein [archaeon]
MVKRPPSPGYESPVPEEPSRQISTSWTQAHSVHSGSPPPRSPCLDYSEAPAPVGQSISLDTLTVSRSYSADLESFHPRAALLLARDPRCSNTPSPSQLE